MGSIASVGHRFSEGAEGTSEFQTTPRAATAPGGRRGSFSLGKVPVEDMQDTWTS